MRIWMPFTIIAPNYRSIEPFVFLFDVLFRSFIYALFFSSAPSLLQFYHIHLSLASERQKVIEWFSFSRFLFFFSMNRRKEKCDVKSNCGLDSIDPSSTYTSFDQLHAAIPAVKRISKM